MSDLQNTTALAPTGRKLAANLSPGSLAPGAGKIVQRTGEPVFCGSIWGTVFGYTEAPNTKDPKRTSLRFVGDFGFRGADGAIQKASECYLPGVLGRPVKAALDLTHTPFDLAVDIVCEPDTVRPSPLGYSYAVYDRMSPPEGSHTDRIAIAAGIMPSPERSLPLFGREVDPETGEIEEPAPEPAPEPQEKRKAKAA